MLLDGLLPTGFQILWGHAGPGGTVSHQQSWVATLWSTPSISRLRCLTQPEDRAERLPSRSVPEEVGRFGELQSDARQEEDPSIE